MTTLSAELWRKKWRIAFVTLLLCMATYAVLSFFPKLYESSASILVEPRANAFSRAADDNGSTATNASVPDDVLMSSQMELVKSADTLLIVIRKLDLISKPEFQASKSPLSAITSMFGSQPDVRDAEQIALAKLLKQITVLRERDSRVISIFVRSEDRQLAADIANAIAQAHITRRADQTIDDTAEATQWLQTEIDKLRTRVNDAESAVAKYRVDHDLFVGPNNTTLIDQQLSDISKQITDAQERKNTARSRANLIRQMLQSGQSITGVTDVQNSVVVQRLLEDKAGLQRDRAQLLSTLLPNHPDIQALTAQIEEIDRQINSEAKKVADALDAEAQIEASLEASLRDDLARLKLSASDATNSNVELQELEREATAQRNLLETYLLRYRDAVARTDSSAALPDLRQITFATAAITPSYPQTMLIIVAVTIVALMGQLGIILLRHYAGTMLREDDREKASSDWAAFGVREDNVLLGKSTAQQPDRADERLTMRERASRLLRQSSGNRKAREIDPGAANSNEWTLADLERHLLRGRDRLVLVAGYDSDADCLGLVDRLAAGLIDKGRNITLVDAGTGLSTRAPGMTDLAAGDVDFGEVVSETRYPNLNEVGWGRLAEIDRSSAKPATLVEALCDLNDAVIVLTGAAGTHANLPLFSGCDALLVVVSAKPLSAERQRQVERDATRLDLTNIAFAVARPAQSAARRPDVA
ncbi:MAG: GumC family protein [Hyphomicrobiaceae bacterium]|nr:GumC family protein [Hyphomicrobiaceae bacterium]MCC0024499.1 GumC family protein [Hyphomicrobiaceae bacterium]